MDDFTRLLFSLAAHASLRTPGRISERLREQGPVSLGMELASMEPAQRDALEIQADQLAQRGVRAMFWTDDEYPGNLVVRGRPAAPVLMYLGDVNLLHRPGLGMCGSRAVTELGTRAAAACGEAVSHHDMVVISGYAKGVDTETHLAALRTGGSTVIVLAEGFDHFRVKKTFQVDYDPRRAIVVSQFAPAQPWRAHAAMARNAIIFGLGLGLVVIEAGEKGGTLAAGEGALRIGRPVFVLDFGEETPPGNRKLLASGAIPVNSVSALYSILKQALKDPAVLDREQRLF